MVSDSIKLLDQHQFDKYAAAWSQHVSHHQDLTAVFQQPDGSPMRGLWFSLKALKFLVSTVGARRIKAQFLLKEDKESEEKRFTLVLYATDANDGRISAYYQAHYLPLPATGTQEAGEMDLLHTDSQSDDFSTQIPNELVHAWLDNWKAASLVTADMFGSSYGPLTGYAFEVGDFLDSFFYSNPLKDKKPPKDKELLVLFGLHQHYPAFPDCYALKQTFGLVLRIHLHPADAPQPTVDFATEKENFLEVISAATTHAELVQAAQGQAATYSDPSDPAGQPFYDFSNPSPPA